MASARFFASSDNSSDYAVGQTVLVGLTRDELFHARKVLRLRVGETVEIVVRDVWSVWAGSVVSLGDGGLAVAIEREILIEPAAYSLTLVFGVSKGDKNDTIVRQATEIGVHALAPVVFSRSVVKFEADKRDKKLTRLSTIAESAAQQSHRSVIPEVLPFVTFGEFIADADGFDHLIILWEEFEGPTLSHYIRSLDSAAVRGSRIALIVGPEGGITATEVEQLQALGAQLASLGPSILRVETACTVATGIAVDALNAQVQG